MVARIRRLAGQKQVGHAGTLDPLATGVLLLVLGDATRLSSYLMDTTKVYCAEIVLGVTTVTDDAEAPTLYQRDVSHLRPADVEAALRPFTGELAQVPPAYAAVRHDGQKLYALARQGVTVQPRPRMVVIHAIELLACQLPRVRLCIRCGPGTYIRSLARDLGNALGVGGYLHALRRAASGTIEASGCVSLETLSQATCLPDHMLPLDRAVLHLPAAILTEDEVRAARTGRPVSLGGRAMGTVRLYGPSGVFIGLGTAEEHTVKPSRVFAGAVIDDACRRSV